MAGGRVATATRGGTNEGGGLPGGGLGRGGARDEGWPLGRDVPNGRRLDDGKRVPVLGGGERDLKRNLDRRGQPRPVRAIRVDCQVDRKAGLLTT